MSIQEQPILKEAEQYVRRIFTLQIDKNFAFHNIYHTLDVVGNVQKIISTVSLNEEEQLAVLLAAWFHDTGYSAGKARNHEEVSQKIATAFLQEKQASQSLIDMVNGCIIATKMPQSPTNLLEQIICDADLFHLGTDHFRERNKNLRKEVNETQNEKISKKDWRKLNIAFLQRHRYFTDFAREHLEPVKQKYLQSLIDWNKKEAKADAEPIVPDTSLSAKDPETVAAGQEKEKDKKKSDRTERGVVAMFKIMSENHINLSQMADSKANIMISVNTIVISIMVSVLLGKLQFYPEYIFPTILLVGICLAAVVTAILATRPNISGGTFTKEDIETKKINLLFFGNFYNMRLEEYDWAMKEMMNDKEYLYGSMIKDIYFLGIVLARKYRFLRISYNIFMYGLVAAIVAFTLAFLLAGQNGK